MTPSPNAPTGMIVEARFTGSDGSLGYRTGRTYLLTIRGNSIVKPTPCPYGSIEAFFRNWQVLYV